MIFFCADHVVAQELVVKSVKLLSSDLTAKTSPCLTNSGDTCALIKIKGDGVAGLEFTDKAQYIEKKYDRASDTYYVYVYRTPKLSFKHHDFLPGEIDMSLSGYRKPKSGKTYQVVLEAQGSEITNCAIILEVSPQNSIVSLNGKKAVFSANGIYEYSATPGTYYYSVSAEDFETEEGSISLNKGDKKTISVKLKPILHEVYVKCNINDAKVYVDDTYYGKVGRNHLPQGKHRIRIQANGYIDKEADVQISSSRNVISYKLEKTNETHIHATTVKIFSDSKHIYKNGKELKDWQNGAEIKFLPGKYGLSDENMIVHEITVSNKPMTVIINGDSFIIK